MSKAAQSKRTALIAKALHIARAHNKSQPEGKADGGGVSFRDMLEVNPRGWGNAPPALDGEIRSTGRNVSPQDISDVMGPLVGQGLESGAPALLRGAGMSPLDFAKDTASRELTPENALRVGEFSLGAVPYERIPSALATAARYAPRTAVGLLGGLGASVGAAESGPEDMSPEAEIARLETAKAQTAAERDKATSQFLSTSKGASDELTGKGKTKNAGKGPVSEALLGQAKSAEAVAARYNAEIDGYNQRIQYLQHKMTPEYAREQDLINKNVEARKPWYERPKLPGTDIDVPGLNAAMTWGPSVGAAALMRFKMNKITDEGMQILNRIKTASNASEEAAGRVALDAWKRSAPKESIAALAKTVLLPGAVRTTGNIGDANFGPEVKDEQGNVLPGGAKQQAQEHVDRLMLRQGAKGLGEELIPQGLQGLEAAGAGAMMAKRPPWGDVEAQTSYLRGIKDPDASTLAKLTGGDGHRSMSPDQIALELVRRRLAAQGAESTLAGSTSKGPTPLWPTAMRGEPTNPALPPPTTKGLLGTSPLELAPPTTSSRTAAEELAGPQKPAANLSLPSPSTPPRVVVKSTAGYHDPDNDMKFVPHSVVKGTRAKGKIKVVKSNAGKSSKQPNADNGPPEDENGIPIKPDKDIDPNGPGNFRDGGMIARTMTLARKYASGGVVGPVVGSTGGRTDALPVKVPAGAYVLPSDFVSMAGENNSNAGVAALDKMFGGHRASRAQGGEVPIMISDGEYVLSPEQVTKIGNGNLDAGHRALDNWVMEMRKRHIATLRSLPAPAR